MRIQDGNMLSEITEVGGGGGAMDAGGEGPLLKKRRTQDNEQINAKLKQL